MEILMLIQLLNIFSWWTVAMLNDYTYKISSHPHNWLICQRHTNSTGHVDTWSCSKLKGHLNLNNSESGHASETFDKGTLGWTIHWTIDMTSLDTIHFATNEFLLLQRKKWKKEQKNSNSTVKVEFYFEMHVTVSSNRHVCFLQLTSNNCFVFHVWFSSYCTLNIEKKISKWELRKPWDPLVGIQWKLNRKFQHNRVVCVDIKRQPRGRKEGMCFFFAREWSKIERERERERERAKNAN